VAYDVWITSTVDELVDRLVRRIGERRGLLVTTPTVERLHGDRLARQLDEAGCDLATFTLAIDEASKGWEQVLAVCEVASGHRLGRSSLLIALSGGVDLPPKPVPESCVSREHSAKASRCAGRRRPRCQSSLTYVS
jgi:3-dehydroquinate synthetase